jgi:predicted lipoprotein
MNKDAGRELIVTVGGLFAIADTLGNIPSEKIKSTAEEIKCIAKQIIDGAAVVIKELSKTLLSEATDYELLDELKRRLSTYKGPMGS